MPRKKSQIFKRTLKTQKRKRALDCPDKRGLITDLKEVSKIPEGKQATIQVSKKYSQQCFKKVSMTELPEAESETVSILRTTQKPDIKKSNTLPPLREWENQVNVINRFRPMFRGGMCPKAAGNCNLMLDSSDVEEFDDADEVKEPKGIMKDVNSHIKESI